MGRDQDKGEKMVKLFLCKKLWKIIYLMLVNTQKPDFQTNTKNEFWNSGLLAML